MFEKNWLFAQLVVLSFLYYNKFSLSFYQFHFVCLICLVMAKCQIAPLKGMGGVDWPVYALS